MKETMPNHTPERNAAVEKQWRIENVPTYLKQFGYDADMIQEAERINLLVAKGEKKLASATQAIYGDLATAYLFNMQRAEEVRGVNSLIHGGFGSAKLEDTVRLAISIDFAVSFSKLYEKNPGYVEFRFMNSLPAFNNRTMADLLRVADESDLAEVHKTFMQIVNDEKEKKLWKFDWDKDAKKSVYPLFEKYFPKKETREVEKSYNGVLDFYSETGTEGGYWAFQDESFIGIPDDTEICVNCHHYRSYIENLDTDAPLQAAASYPLSDIMEGKEKPKVCSPEEHVWKLAFPEGKWSYEGLHVLESGDQLTIFDSEHPTEIVWEGDVQLEQHNLFTEHAFGMWIHADQEGVERDTWATWFLKGNPAKLTTKRTEYIPD